MKEHIKKIHNSHFVSSDIFKNSIKYNKFDHLFFIDHSCIKNQILQKQQDPNPSSASPYYKLQNYKKGSL